MKLTCRTCGSLCCWAGGQRFSHGTRDTRHDCDCIDGRLMVECEICDGTGFDPPHHKCLFCTNGRRPATEEDVEAAVRSLYDITLAWVEAPYFERRSAWEAWASTVRPTAERALSKVAPFFPAVTE